MLPLIRRGRARGGGEVPAQSNSSLSHTPIEEGTSSNSEIHRNVRGHTRLERLWNREQNAPKKVVQNNNKGQPIGNGARDLGQFLGTMVRRPRFCSFKYSDWRFMPQKDKDIVWQRVQDVFEIDNSLKDWVLQSFNKKWKDYKAQLKRANYIPFRGDVVGAKRNRPLELDQAEWDWLVDFWESDTGKMREEKGKVNREKLTMPHTSGTKSFARRIHEEMINNDGMEPSRVDMFCKLHKKKDGTFVNATAVEKFDQMNALVSQLPQESQGTSVARDKIFSQVMGEDSYGRCRLHGLGVSPKDLHGPQPTRRELLEDNRDMRKQLDMVVSVLGQLTGVEGDIHDIMANLSKKGPGNYRAHPSDIGSSRSFEDETQHD